MKAPCQEIFSLLRSTIYGTTGVKINHRDTDKKLSQLHQPDFHTLWKKDNLLAVAVYCKRTITIRDEEVDAFYIRYFSVSDQYQNQGLGKELTEKIEAHYLKTVSRKTVFYAYIEKKNLRSIGVSKHFNVNVIGEMKTIFFSRFFPKKNRNCRIAKPSELEYLKIELQKLYGGHTNTTFNRVGYEDSYYVYVKDDEIIAGLQLINTKWKIFSLPGLMGWISLRLFPMIPILNRVADGKNMKFSGVEAIYYRESEEDKVLSLLEHALAEAGNYKAFIYLDIQDNLFRKMSIQKDLGFMNKVQNSPSVKIIHQSLHLSEEDESYLASSPKYVSAFDVT